MKDTTRGLWHKPELIVLVRSNPEEHVLTVCKKMNEHNPGWPNCAAGESHNRCSDPGFS